MPLEPYPRGNVWWAKGRIEFEGKAITEYQRCSTGSSTEAGAWEWINQETQRQRHRYILGEERPELTLGEAIADYDAKPADAGYLAKIIEAKPEIVTMTISEVTPKWIKKLGLELYPTASTDTAWRQVVTPLRAAINNAHEMGCGTPPIKVKHYSEKERIDRDKARNKQSRVERVPADLEWVEAFRAHADPHNAALIAFMFETASRIAQAVELRPEDLNLPARQVLLPAAKGHPQQWVDISHGLMIELANLPAKRPHNRITGDKGEPRVFGYGTRSGYRKRWQSICKAAGIPYISAHPAGRHGFATHVRHALKKEAGSAMKAGRWKSLSAFSRYDHAPDISRELRDEIRTYRVQGEQKKKTNQLKTGKN